MVFRFPLSAFNFLPATHMPDSPLIVVTGAYGFIGNRLLLRLLRSHPTDHLLAVDHPAQPAKGANIAAIASVPFLGHNEFLQAIEAGLLHPKTILHMGACSDTTEARWDYLLENNVGYSQRLWKWCAANAAALIYASSAATYGDGSRGFDDEAPISALEPLNLYGRSKHDFDLWVQSQFGVHSTQPTQCVGLKFFNVFGPGEQHKGRMASMVFHARNQILATGRARLFKSHRPDYSDGGQLRDFISVEDVVQVILQLLERPDVSGLFNLGTAQARSFNDLVLGVFSALQRKPVIDYFPMPDDLQGKYQYFTQASMRKMASHGIDVSFRSLEQSIADCIHQYP